MENLAVRDAAGLTRLTWLDLHPFEMRCDAHRATLAAMDAFMLELLERVKALFAPGEVETLTVRHPSGEPDPRVRVVHRETGLVVEEGTWGTQVQNQIAALLLLRRRLDER